MNDAEQRRALQRARNAERQAKVSKKQTDWLLAATLYRIAKDEQSAERCEIEADKCYWSA